jgi:hypothetical protein
MSGQCYLAVSQKDARSVLVAGNIVTFEQYPLDRMINSRCFVNRLISGRLGRNLTPQSLILPRGDLNEYSHGIYLTLVERLNSLNGQCFVGSNGGLPHFPKQLGKNQADIKEPESANESISGEFHKSDFYVLLSFSLSPITKLEFLPGQLLF